MNRRRFLQSAGVVASTPWLTGFGNDTRLSIDGTAMGTFFRIDFADTVSGVRIENLQNDVRSVLESTENCMSLYRTESELCRFNSTKNTQWQSISQETARVVRAALAIGEQSLGVFSCTVGAASRHWGFGPQPVTDAYLIEQISSEKMLVRGGIELSEDECYLRKKYIDTEVDLNAIAKGDAVDRLAELMAQYGLTRYLIEIGGEFYGSVESGVGDAWTIGITHPEGGLVDRVYLSDKGIATSGDYIHERHLGKRRLTHLIDPDSGEPIDSSLALVSVIADTTIQADAWSTALQVMGFEQGLLFANQNNMAAFFLSRKPGGYVGYATEWFDRYRVTGNGGSKWLQG